jgi:transglycosylase-like protein with SLT domain
MLVDPGSMAAGSAVTGAIRQASQATGTSFSYLLATAQVESGLNPHAGASTSSARGLFQFVEQTWLGTLKQSGPALGYGRYANAISRTASGHYEVKDPTLRSQILKLRNDPAANAVMAGAFTKANAAYLAQKLGREPSEGELYIAHFLGAGGAARLISQAASNPNATAAAAFGNAAQANPSIFYDRRTGAARTVAQVRDILTARYDLARSRPDLTAAPVTQAASNPAPITAPLSIVPAPTVTPASIPLAAAQARTVPVPTAPDTAGITSAYAAAVPIRNREDTQIFHGLFADPASGASDSPAQPLARAARAAGPLWSVPGSSAAGAAAPPPTPVVANFLDLFKDTANGS